MRIEEKTRFARIWPSASKIGFFLRIDPRESATRWCANCPPTKFRNERAARRGSDLFLTRVWCIPEFGAENKSALFQDFLLLSAVLRGRGRFQNPRQTPVRTKLRLKRLPSSGRFWPGSLEGKTSVRPSKSWKNKHVGTEIHDPKAWTSITREVVFVKATQLQTIGLANHKRYPRHSLGRRQKAPENATHPKTQVTDRSQNLRFRVCCVFGCSLFRSKRAPNNTRKRNTPENADSGNGRLPAVFGCVAFSGAFWRLQNSPRARWRRQTFMSQAEVREKQCTFW